MMFYDDDSTVKSTYQKFYMLGTPGLDWNPMAKKEQSETITGGANQCNDSHYIELLWPLVLHFIFLRFLKMIYEQESRIMTQSICIEIC